MSIGRAIGGCLVVAFLLGLTLPPSPAYACSCAEPTIEEFVEREPDGAVARIRRIDADGGVQGVGLVEEVLHGGPLPEQIALDLDGGADCLPWIAVSDVAVLGLVRDGNTWRTTECAKLDPTTGLGEVTVDPAAAGPAAAVVLGRWPGADVLALDGHLRVLATASIDLVSYSARPCGDGLLAPRYEPDGGMTLVRVSLPDLRVRDERVLSDTPDEHVELLDARCDGDRVDVAAVHWADRQEAVVVRDVFGEQDVLPFADALSVAFAGDDVLTLRGTSGVATLTVERHDGATDAVGEVLHLDETLGYDISVAPGGQHALVRASAEEPMLLLLDLETGAEVARSTGWWMPVHRPWLAADRILQVDEDSGGVGNTGLASYRIVDLDLAVVAELPPTPAWNAMAFDGPALLSTSEHVRVLDASGGAVRGVEPPWAAGIESGFVRGPVADGADVEPVTMPPIDATAAPAADRSPSFRLILGLVLVATLAAGVVSARRR